MPYSKAITAFITPLIVNLLLPLGITAETTVANAVAILVTAGITAIAVYVIPNK